MASSEKKPGRFSGLRRTAERVEAGTITPHPEEPTTAQAEAAAEPTLRQSTAKSGSLKEKLGAKKAAPATVRMSVEMPTEMHSQITHIANRAGVPKAEVVRQILLETLPELL